MSLAIGSFKIIASKLQDLLARTVPESRRKTKKAQVFPITISYDQSKSVLTISESKYELAAIDLDIPCEWPEDVQINGVVFRKAVDTYKVNDLLEIRSLHDNVEIINGVSKFKMERIDGAYGNKIIKKPIPKNPRHKGKVIVKEEPFIGRVELDATWDFSARMPVPHHQYPDNQLPNETTPEVKSNKNEE